MIILIVEDAPEIVELWRRMLSRVGEDFRVASNLADARTEMDREPNPDLILLDLKLEGGTSEMEVLAEIRAFKEINPAVVVVVITGNPQAALPAMAMEFGADGFRTKISMAGQDELLRAVKEAFRKNWDGTEKTYRRRLDLYERLDSFVS